MNETINTIFVNMPTTIRSYVVMNQDDSYTIVLNSRLSRESNIKAYNHELCHIIRKDYEKDIPANQIELQAHKYFF